jgi:hypothetical protein
LPKFRSGHAKQSFYGGIQHEEEDHDHDKVPLINDSNVNISHIAGTIEVSEKDRLKKLLFRSTRGKALTFFKDFEIYDTNSTGKSKAVYIVLF